MTRTYAAKRLLEHGPLTVAEFREITRWPSKVARSTLGRLVDSGKVDTRKISPRRNVYRLAE